jgi:hypothetical protein
MLNLHPSSVVLQLELPPLGSLLAVRVLALL